MSQPHKVTSEDRCDLQLRDASGSRFMFECRVCGAVVKATRNKPPIRKCSLVKRSSSAEHVRPHTELPGWYTCSYRGSAIATVTGTQAGCGCGGMTIEVHPCGYFNNEPVLKKAAARCLEKIQSKVPEYNGKTCQECKVPSAAGEPETLPATPPPPQTIGVVVTCHNYGRFLRECLDSILGQTLLPERIVLVDDASDDETPAIASDYAQRGVQYLRVECQDVAAARNAGSVLCGKIAYLCFVDADDILPTNYLQALHDGMADPRCAVTYPQCDRFNGEKRIGLSPWIITFDPVALRRQNFACATSLMRRQALEQVGGWQSYKYGLHDWDLWLRIVGAGWTMRYVPETALRYRIHGASMSDARHGRHECGAEVMSRSQLTVVVTLFSGRAWMLDRWFESLSAIEWTRENLHLVAVDNSRNPEFATRLREKLDDWRHTYLCDDRRIDESTPTEEAARGAAFRRVNVYPMGVHLARLYALASQYLPAATANVWSVEDDVTVNPDALRILATDLFRLRAASVSGCLRSRFSKRMIAWQERKCITEPPAVPVKITSTGFFCHLVRREAWDKIAWRPGSTGTDVLPYYDFAACDDISTIGPIYLTGAVRCKHWQSDGTALDA